MIDQAKIQGIMAKMSSDIGITLNRQDQPGKVPAYPFLSYKIINDNPLMAHQNPYLIASGVASGTVTRTTWEKTRTMVSIAVCDRNKITDIINYANLAVEWFGSVSGQDYCDASGVACNQVSNIQDRTQYLDNLYYENKYGFDIAFDYKRDRAETYSKINVITLTPSPEGVDGDPIIITE